jgi:hypothetical protein
MAIGINKFNMSTVTGLDDHSPTTKSAPPPETSASREPSGGMQEAVAGGRRFGAALYTTALANQKEIALAREMFPQSGKALIKELADSAMKDNSSFASALALVKNNMALGDTKIGTGNNWNLRQELDFCKDIQRPGTFSAAAA